MLIMLEAGRRLGRRRRLQETDSDRGNLSTIETAVFAVFGLLMALTFSGAASRINEKRMLIAEEVAAVQTAYLRLQLLPNEQRPALQELFRRYVDSRLETYRKMPLRQEQPDLTGRSFLNALSARVRDVFAPPKR